MDARKIFEWMFLFLFLFLCLFFFFCLFSFSSKSLGRWSERFYGVRHCPEQGHPTVRSHHLGTWNAANVSTRGANHTWNLRARPWCVGNMPGDMSGDTLPGDISQWYFPVILKTMEAPGFVLPFEALLLARVTIRANILDSAIFRLLLLICCLNSRSGSKLPFSFPTVFTQFPLSGRTSLYQNRQCHSEADLYIKQPWKETWNNLAVDLLKRWIGSLQERCQAGMDQ